MELKETLDRINRLSEELEKLRPLSAENEQRIMQKFRLDWNYNSNNLEGNTLTYGETKALLLFGITAQGKPLKDHMEIEGHNEAIEYIIKVARLQEPLTEAMIRELHKMILHEPYEIEAITPDGQPTRKRVEIGKYKTLPNHVQTITGEIFRFATPDETPAKMGELMKWYKENLSNKKLHPLMFAAEFHYRFIRIHPFDDGNGRIVRILMNLLLMQKGLPPVIVKTKDKENYYRALQQADSGQLEVFFDYIGEQLVRSMELMIKAAKGEEIEEDDDVDKEIALLKQELANVEEIKTVKSLDIIKKIVIEGSKIVVDKMVGKLQNITDLYLSSYVLYSTDAKNSLFKMDLNQIIEIIEASNVENNDIEFNIYLYLTNFKKNLDNVFSDVIAFKFLFSKYYYIFNTNKSDIELKKLYHQHLSESDIKKIVKDVKKGSLFYIRQKLGKK